jgi:hypothetical protein
MFVLERWLFLLIRNLCLNCLKYMWKRLLLSYIIYCLWFLGVIVMTVLCGIDFLLLLSGVWLVAYEFHNSRSSLGWIFLSIQLLWGVALFIFIVSCGGSAQLIALVFNTANKSDWGHFYLRCHLLENSNGFIFCRNYYRSNVTCWGKYY